LEAQARTGRADYSGVVPQDGTVTPATDAPPPERVVGLTMVHTHAANTSQQAAQVALVRQAFSPESFQQLQNNPSNHLPAAGGIGAAIANSQLTQPAHGSYRPGTVDGMFQNPFTRSARTRDTTLGQQPILPSRPNTLLAGDLNHIGTNILPRAENQAQGKQPGYQLPIRSANGPASREVMDVLYFGDHVRARPLEKFAPAVMTADHRARMYAIYARNPPRLNTHPLQRWRGDPGAYDRSHHDRGYSRSPSPSPNGGGSSPSSASGGPWCGGPSSSSSSSTSAPSMSASS
ncbi:unnamed protein product, partial [Amoebophrya sp. A25]